MPKKVSASRAVLPRKRAYELDDLFESVSSEAAAFVARNPVLRAKLARAAERLGETFPGRALHLRRYEDPDSGEHDLFAEIERTGDWRGDYDRLCEFIDAWIHDREDPKVEVNFDFHFRR
ncbi:MAG: hypothetical protein QOC81_1716 [Thermoanaerobaculia bacterium]|jgi:hypothetical protein|nr:hypothetical protein [Thermoanaerobaculia bacterium]